MRKRVVILGSTGSIGQNALKVAAEHPTAFEVVGLTAGTSAEALAAQALAVRPRRVAIADAAQAGALARRLAGSGIVVEAGPEGVAAVAAMEGADVVLVAITGAAALAPALAAIRLGRTMALANKETMVIAGRLMQAEAAEHGAALVPVDSEHCAIFQCLDGKPRAHVRRLLLTGSGGPLKEIPAERFDSLSREEVLNHPRWRMGPKISVDSATMMNKGLEVIEARWLFDIPVRQIEVLIHPEAVIHSMVEFVDGSVLAHLGVTDMRIPIQYALTYPDRLPTGLPPLDLAAVGRLTFEPPNRVKFPCLSFGYAAAEQGGTAPAVLNAANEVCVQAFLDGRIPFTKIAATIDAVLSRHRLVAEPALDDVVAADRWARDEAVRCWPHEVAR
ncbi:MAG: 1-deoxy-D-xylulose-5-phosphate reductoisomerase [Omnitrophica WOR_2 bacterium RIFCSPHIGHO2_02_FULL_68_15]|nr:MAG: 1-deoxy-D-xylulose-5-phosphate reductoisomerase [Omnitrophica WOR_2 bacterium RIFCSPHIGHO2_02_FULL_68_15]